MIRNEFDVDDGPAFAAACAPLILELGGAFMMSSYAKAFSADHGLQGRQGYVIGRGSVLGDVDADVVTAAFGFRPADVIRENWEAAHLALDSRTALPAYAEACRAWGRERLSSVDGAGRLAELLGWVVDGTDVAGLSLYAGWRAVPLPDDDRGRAIQQVHVLREYRGGMHLVAVVASGLTPLQAILSSDEGVRGAAAKGWEEPFEDATRLRPARVEAEALTDRLVSPSWDILGHDERLELLALLTAATHAAFPR